MKGIAVNSSKQRKKIEFIAGYYEWNIFINGECIYSFGDLAECFESGNSAEEDTEILLDAMKESFENEEKAFPLNNEETEALSKIMTEKLMEVFNYE